VGPEKNDPRYGHGQITFPKEFLQEAGRRNLFGCRYPKKWGGMDMDWATTCMIMEEVGTLRYIFS
jgi:alkylation response protein AidB-like acyl-CoA dehydrogenase